MGTLYAYFNNLTELMQSLWKDPVARLINEFDEALVDIDNPLDKLHTLLQTYAKFATEQRAVYRGAFLFVRPGSHEQPTQVKLDDDRFFSLFRNAVVEAQNESLVRQGDPNQISQTIWSGLHGAIALPLNMDRLTLVPPEEAIQDMIDVLIIWLKS